MESREDRHLFVRNTALRDERVRMVRSKPRVSGGRLMRGMAWEERGGWSGAQFYFFSSFP